MDSEFIKTRDGMIVNQSESHYNQLVVARESQRKVDAVDKRMNSLENDLTAIKSMLFELLGRKTN